jgi:transcriptional regulator with XRE-family HTH domain
MVDRIKLLCGERGRNLTALERELGFGKSTIRKWDKNAPSVDKVMLVADFFGVSVDYLIGRTDDRALEAEPDAEELEFLDTYKAAKESDRAAVRATLKVIDKLLGEDEQ